MCKEITDKVNRDIYKKYPNLVGISPKIIRQPGDKLLLIYNASGELPGGKVINQVIRVVCDSHGEVIKITSSRG